MEKLQFKTGIKDAFNGFSDIFIQINLFFEQNDENTANNSELKNIKFIVANAATGIKIAENTLQNIKLEHKKDDLQKIASNLVFQINKVLKFNLPFLFILSPLFYSFNTITSITQSLFFCNTFNIIK